MRELRFAAPSVLILGRRAFDRSMGRLNREAPPDGPTVLSIGSFITQNFGDQALHLAIRRRLLSDLSANVVKFPIKSPKATLDSRHLNLMQKAVFALAWLPRHYWKLFRVARSADCAVIGGGHLLHDVTWPTAPQFFLTCLILRAARCPFQVLAVGAGPIRRASSRWLFGAALSMSDRVHVRDRLSHDLLHRCPGSGRFLSPTITPDLAFTLFPKPPLVKSPHGVVGINPIAYMRPGMGPKAHEAGHRSYIERMAGLVRAILDSMDSKVVLFSTVPWEDEETVKQLADRFRDCDRVTALQPETMEQGMQASGNVDLLVATRLHTLIFGLAQGVPAVALSDQPRIIGLMRDLDAEDLLFDIAAFSLEEVVDHLSNLNGSRGRELMERVREQMSRADDGLRTALHGIEQICARKAP